MQKIRAFFQRSGPGNRISQTEALPEYSEVHAEGEEPTPPTYKRLSELYISSNVTLTNLGLEFLDRKNREPLFYLDIDRGSHGVAMNLHEGKSKKDSVVAAMTRESQQLFLFELASGEEMVRMEERMIGFWCFSIPLVESAASIAAPADSETKGEQKIGGSSTTQPSAKTTFAWKVLTAAPVGNASKPRVQGTFANPDVQLMNWQTGEVHAVYFTDLRSEIVGRVTGRLQFRRSFGQGWERLVLISLGSLLEKERYRRKKRGTFQQGADYSQGGGGM